MSKQENTLAYIALFIDNTSDMQEMAWFGIANPYQIGSNLPPEFKISIATIEVNDWTSPFVISVAKLRFIS